MSTKKTINEAVVEAADKIRSLAERVRYRRDSLLPSELESEFAKVVETFGAEHGDGPPDWGDFVERSRGFLTAAAKSQSVGLSNHLHAQIETDADLLVETLQRRARAHASLKTGDAMSRSDFTNLSPAAAMAHIKAGKSIVDEVLGKKADPA
jgi:hypothetical protein